MKCNVVTLFPEMFSGFLNCGIVARAQKSGLLDCQFYNPRAFTDSRRHDVDDRPYGGGPGMVMQVEPLRAAISAAKASSPSSAKVVYVAPEGKRLNTEMARQLASEPGVVFVSGRYEGIDQRIIDQDIDEIISIGDYVLTGGELPIMVLIDAMVRWLPGALGDEASKLEDSFTSENKGLLDCPHYSRPPLIDGQAVPTVLLSGDHAAIEKWRQKQKLGKTWQLRPDLLEKASLDKEDLILLNEFKSECET
tara:strand:+ start:22222 stop:22971 length:750 start_codon:yes stop_codon:yes gene_type:complete